MTSASVVTVAYRSGEALTRLLASLEGAEAVRETIVVDNGAGGPEIERAREREGVRVLEFGTNLGFAAGCNRGAAAAESDVLVFLNPDTVAEVGAVAGLVRALEDPEVGVAMARLRLLDKPELLNSSGNILHVSGLAWAGGYEEPAESVSTLRDIPYASGAALGIRSALFHELGGFTEELFMYQEDLELSWRARLRGLRVVITPEADVYHDYEYGRHAAKHYLLERNRLIFVLTAYPARLLLALAPVLVAAELGLTALALVQRWPGGKLAGWAWCARHARWLARHRGETLAAKRVPTRELAGHLTPILDPKMIDLPWAVRFVNPLLAAYWQLARKLL